MEKRKAKVIIILVIIILLITFYNIISTVRNKTEVNYTEILADKKQNEEIAISNLESENVQSTEDEMLIKVYVTGEVNAPGVIEIKEGDRISDAIEKAGGTTNMADLSNVNLAYCLEDGQKLYIPNRDEKVNEYLSIENGEEVIQTTEIMNSNTSNSKVNINKATEEQLQNIPGVGPVMAQKIVAYRKENGNFKSIEDLKNVSRNRR